MCAACVGDGELSCARRKVQDAGVDMQREGSAQKGPDGLDERGGSARRCLGDLHGFL